MPGGTKERKGTGIFLIVSFCVIGARYGVDASLLGSTTLHTLLCCRIIQTTSVFANLPEYLSHYDRDKQVPDPRRSAN